MTKYFMHWKHILSPLATQKMFKFWNTLIVVQFNNNNNNNDGDDD
jgi:hypothetical protein